jgi:hypothetical protein
MAKVAPLLLLCSCSLLVAFFTIASILPPALQTDTHLYYRSKKLERPREKVKTSGRKYKKEVCLFLILRTFSSLKGY